MKARSEAVSEKMRLTREIKRVMRGHRCPRRCHKCPGLGRAIMPGCIGGAALGLDHCTCGGLEAISLPERVAGLEAQVSRLIEQHSGKGGA